MHWLDITRPSRMSLRRAVRHDGDLVAVLEEAERELEARLPGADDQDLSHSYLLEPLYSMSFGIAGSACSGPIAE